MVKIPSFMEHECSLELTVFTNADCITILSHLKPLHTNTHYLFKIRCNICHSTRRFPKMPDFPCVILVPPISSLSSWSFQTTTVFKHEYKIFGSRDSLVRVATDYGLDGVGSVPGSSRRFFSVTSRPSLWPTQLTLQWVPRLLSKR